MRLGKLVRQARKRLNLSQAELAARAGVGLATIQNIEANRANPAFQTLISIFQVLKVNVSFEQRLGSVDWAMMNTLGMPLTGKVSETFLPTRSRLIEELDKFDPTLLKGREAKAAGAWLRAIRDHFPSVWKDVPMAVRAWGQNQPVPPKLRRIALQKLAEYL